MSKALSPPSSQKSNAHPAASTILTLFPWAPLCKVPICCLSVRGHCWRGCSGPPGWRETLRTNTKNMLQQPPGWEGGWLMRGGKLATPSLLQHTAVKYSSRISLTPMQPEMRRLKWSFRRLSATFCSVGLRSFESNCSKESSWMSGICSITAFSSP